MSQGDLFEHTTWTTVDADCLLDLPSSLSASVDWSTMSCMPCDPEIHFTRIPQPSQIQRVPLSLKEHPFFLDMGATTHLSPEKMDFLDLHPIPPCLISGIGGSTISAMGVGTIRLSMGHSARLVLEDVLYVPVAAIRLISVLALN